MYTMTSHTRHEILGVYFFDDEERPRFVVVGKAGRWNSVLQPYYENIVTSKGLFYAEFNFHALYTAMLCYPPFANSVLDTERFSLEHCNQVYSTFPLLAGKLNPLNIKLSYKYVTQEPTP